MSETITGNWGKPVNTSAHQKGGIHDDATASELGFSGGTVAGSIHMEQFLPLLLQTFGEEWWQSGVLSLYFRHATMDRDPVQCYLQMGEDEQAKVWMQNENGDLVMEGTANLSNCPAPTALRARLAELRPPAELRVMQNFSIGQVTNATAQVSSEWVDRQQLRVITESHESFVSAESFGQRALPYTLIVRMFDSAESLMADWISGPYVGLYGGIEIEFQNGPVLADTDYDATSEVVGLSDSPKTEILWRESSLTKDGQPIAKMLKIDRLMKGSSPLWQ